MNNRIVGASLLFSSVCALSAVAAADPTVTVGLGVLNGTPLSVDLLGVNGGPLPMPATDATGAVCATASLADATALYQQLGVSSVRTHDFQGPLDLRAMARWNSALTRWDYDFTGSQVVPLQCPSGATVMAALVNSDTAWNGIAAGGFEPYLRVGNSFITSPSWLASSASSTTPTQLADAVETVVQRYAPSTQGLSVEFWNEPNNDQFWANAQLVASRLAVAQRYCEAATRVRALSTASAPLLIGGPGVAPSAVPVSLSACTADPCTPTTYLWDFLSYVSAHCPTAIDFVSFHVYSNNPQDFVDAATSVRTAINALPSLAARDLALHLTEYNVQSGQQGTAQAVAVTTAAWIALAQQHEVSRAFYYRGNNLVLPGASTGAPLAYEDGTGLHFSHQGEAFALWSRFVRAFGHPTNSTVTSPHSKVTIAATRGRRAGFAVLMSNTDSVAHTVRVVGPASCANARFTWRWVRAAGGGSSPGTSSGTDFGSFTLPASSIGMVETMCAP